MISRKNVIIRTLKKLYTVNDFPTFIHPKIVTGMLKTKYKIPVVIGKAVFASNEEISWATPVNPLAYTFAGIKNIFKETAFNKAPKIIKKIFFASVILRSDIRKRLVMFKLPPFVIQDSFLTEKDKPRQ